MKGLKPWCNSAKLNAIKSHLQNKSGNPKEIFVLAYEEFSNIVTTETKNSEFNQLIRELADAFSMDIIYYNDGNKNSLEIPNKVFAAPLAIRKKDEKIYIMYTKGQVGLFADIKEINKQPIQGVIDNPKLTEKQKPIKDVKEREKMKEEEKEIEEEENQRELNKKKRMEEMKRKEEKEIEEEENQRELNKKKRMEEMKRKEEKEIEEELVVKKEKKKLDQQKQMEELKQQKLKARKSQLEQQKLEELDKFIKEAELKREMEEKKELKKQMSKKENNIVKEPDKSIKNDSKKSNFTESGTSGIIDSTNEMYKEYVII